MGVGNLKNINKKYNTKVKLKKIFLKRLKLSNKGFKFNKSLTLYCQNKVKEHNIPYLLAYENLSKVYKDNGQLMPNFKTYLKLINIINANIIRYSIETAEPFKITKIGTISFFRNKYGYKMRLTINKLFGRYLKIYKCYPSLFIKDITHYYDNLFKIKVK